MKGRIICLTMLLVFAGAGAPVWAAYTNIIIDKTASEDWMCTGSNPYDFHNWDGNDHENDTHALIFTVEELPDQYQLRFDLTVVENPEEDWAPLTRPYGSPEVHVGIVPGTINLPVDNGIAGSAKIMFQGFMDQLYFTYTDTQGQLWYLGMGGDWTTEQASFEVLFDDPYVPYTRSLEFIKESDTYTFNCYDEFSVLVMQGKVPISSVKDVPGDVFVGGDPVRYDHSIKCTIEYLGEALPPGTYIPLVQGWNLVTADHAGAIAASSIYFSDDEGVTLVSPATAESSGWAQGTLYYYDSAEKIFKTVPGDSSSLEWSKAYWIYAATSGKTLVLLWD